MQRLGFGGGTSGFLSEYRAIQPEMQSRIQEGEGFLEQFRSD